MRKLKPNITFLGFIKDWRFYRDGPLLYHNFSTTIFRGQM